MTVTLHEMTALFTLNSLLISADAIVAALSPSCFKLFLAPIVGCPVLSLVLIVRNARWLRIEYRTVVSATEDVLTSDQKEVLARQLQDGVFITRRKKADSRLNVAYLLSFVGIVLLVLALGLS